MGMGGGGDCMGFDLCPELLMGLIAVFSATAFVVLYQVLDPISTLYRLSLLSSYHP